MPRMPPPSTAGTLMLLAGPFAMGVMLRPSEYPKEWCRCAPDRFSGAGAERGRSGLVSVQRSNGSTVNPFPGEEHFPQFPPESRGARCIFDTEPEEGPSSCHEKAAISGFPYDERERLPDRTGKIRRADGRQTERGTPDRLCG